MAILPSKTNSERIYITVDFMDELPWMATIQKVAYKISIHTGDPESPSSLKAYTKDINGSSVVVQLAVGTVGVIYNVCVRVQSDGLWYEKEFKLAIRPDVFTPASFFEYRAIYTSHPYAQMWESESTLGMVPVGGEIITLVRHATLESEDTMSFIVPSGGIIRPALIVVNFKDDQLSFLVPSGGFMDNVRVDSKVGPDAFTGIMIPSTGIMTLVPKGFMVDNTTVGLTFTSGTFTHI